MSGGSAADRFAERLSAVLGDRTAKALSTGLSLHTVGDLLRHYPRRYAERGELTDLARLEVDEQVTVLARVESVTSRSMRARRGKILEAVVTDGSARLTLTFFNQAWRERELTVGRQGLFAGKVGEYRGKRQLANPDYQLLPEDEEVAQLGHVPDEQQRQPLQQNASTGDTEVISRFTRGLVPIYPASAGVPSWTVNQCVTTVLDTLTPADVLDPLPSAVRARRDLMALHAALLAVHHPRNHAENALARRRLAYDEAFVLQIALARRRAQASALPATARPGRSGGLLDAFDASLPFTLTAGQQTIGEQLAADLARPHPMHRLLQGEVGSGKTVVALRAMLRVIDAGGQAALLAPTEVLAVQHHRSITALLGDLAAGGMLGGAEVGTRVVLLTGSQPAAARRRALLDAASGEAGIVVGTHALLQDKVSFLDLGLVVVDEQHRFGVEQRDALRAKATHPPHVLVMTATPIPRTVAMTVFGDLEVSTLAELPAGRAPITTHVVPGDNEQWVTRTWTRVREEVRAGHQVYVVCPRIGEDGSQEPAIEQLEPDEDDRRPAAAAIDVAAMLAGHPVLRDMRIGLLHGRLPADVKDATMTSFAAGDVDVLVATTVIEVGVDVANATVMVVMDADRFGVSQLHQLRGRVGRGGLPGLCLLVTAAAPGSPARERLEAVAATTDGFELSQFDLETRREGDVLGAAQSGGRSSLRLLRVVRDVDLIADARQDAAELVEADPELTAHPALRRELVAALPEERQEFLDRG